MVAVNGNGLGREGETLAVVGDGGVKWKKGFRERKVIRCFFSLVKRILLFLAIG